VNGDRRSFILFSYSSSSPRKKNREEDEVEEGEEKKMEDFFVYCIICKGKPQCQCAFSTGAHVLCVLQEGIV